MEVQKMEDKFQFTHKNDATNVYTAERINRNQYKISWENGILGLGEAINNIDFVKRSLEGGYWTKITTEIEYTTYIVCYQTGSSDEIKLAQIESEDVVKANEKVKQLFSEFESIGNRKYKLIDVVPLHSIRKLDALD